MSPRRIAAWCRLETPAASAGQGAGRGAIAVIGVRGDVPAALRGLGIAAVEVGAARLRNLGGIDEGIVARWAADSASIMPHAGPAVVRAILERAASAGITIETAAGAALSAADFAAVRARHPEARTTIEALMLNTLARAASPAAIDLLLDQPGRWTAAGLEAEDAPSLVAQASAAQREQWWQLARLIDPALVVALGAPNIGKSTLLNELAGRTVALVADVPGTTRDHVGVLLDLGGVVVRYLDLPGVRAPGGPGSANRIDEIDAEAQALALRMAERADLVLAASDPEHEAVEALLPGGAGDVLRVGLRADREAKVARAWPGGRPELAVSAARQEGLEALVEAIGERLVPRAARRAAGTWPFWLATAAETTRVEYPDAMT